MKDLRNLLKKTPNSIYADMKQDEGFVKETSAFN